MNLPIYNSCPEAKINPRVAKLIKKISKSINKQYKSKQQKDGVTPQSKKWLKEFNNEHFDVLKELAKR